MVGRSRSFRVSSWKRSQTFRPSIAVVLNVTPNHMDRYETFNDYAAAKHRIFMNQTAEDVAVLNADDPTVSSWASGLRAKVMNFSVKKELDNGVFLRGRELIFQEQVLLNVDEMKLRGLHNVENTAAAFAAGIAAGASIESHARDRADDSIRSSTGSSLLRRLRE